MNKILFFWIYVCDIISSSSISSDSAVLILARGGSKGVRLKNLEQIGGKSLVRIAIEKAQKAGFEDITVSTDHPLIALEAIESNAKTFHRSRVTATDWAPSIWAASEFMSHRPGVDILILLQATSPFTKSTQIREALVKLSKPVAFDCVFAVTRSHKLRWHYKNENLIPVNFDVNKRPRRQDWIGEYLETGAFYITRKILIEKGQFQNNNCTIWELTDIESLEVDTYDDLRLANAIFKENIV